MKRVLLSLALVIGSYSAYSQVVVAGVSPAAVQGNYDYSVQANCGSWPGETDDGTWGVLSNIDFNVPGSFVQAEAVLVEDGSTGLNPQGNPVSQEGCNALINNTDMDPTNDLTGKIAVIYRNTCSFVQKIQNAQDAGAVAAIIVNREDALIGMLGDATDGPNVTIPAVFVSNVSGAQIVQSIENGDQPIMFIGNKQGAFANDAGAIIGEFIVSDYAGSHNTMYDGFTPGIQVYNYGTGAQDVTVTATITSPGGAADYTSAVGPIAMNPTDTLSIFDGNPEDFGAWQLGVGNYPDGDYTLTYNITLGSGADDFPFDNTYSVDFKVQGNVISLSRLNTSNEPVANTFPFNATANYRSCMMFQEPNASSVGIRGLYFTPYTDTSQFVLEGAEVLLYAYQWNDTWTDVTNPGFTSFNEYFTDYPIITTASYIVPSDDDNGDIAYQDFGTPFVLQDNVRYLFCVESTDLTNEVTFGYDNAVDYDGNYGIYLQPISPVYVDDTWYTGWNTASAPSIGLRTFDPAELGLDNTEMLEGSAYPNPANDLVTVLVSGEGAATLQVTDLAGKVALTSNVTLVNGSTNVNIESLESGVYIFNVTLENGQTAQFNVVKK